MNESRIALGKRIQELRRKAGLTQEQLAEKAGLSLKHLGELERGRGNPTLASLENMSEALGFSVAELFDYEHETMEPAEVRSSIVQILDQASDKECKLLYRILRTVMR